jgi:hypothetical protein
MNYISLKVKMGGRCQEKMEPGKVNDILTAFLEGHFAEYLAPNEKRGE